MPTERWPPVYDAEQLLKQIADLAKRGVLFENFFSTKPEDVPWCQGDIVRLPMQIPYISKQGAAVLENDDHAAWLLISNTCDLFRSIEEVEWAQACPIFNLGNDDDLTQPEIDALRRYTYSRQFYIPDWAERSPRIHHVAQFTMPITVARDALNGAERLARLSEYSWILLHSCFVRFLARDDGRFD